MLLSLAASDMSVCVNPCFMNKAVLLYTKHYDYALYSDYLSTSKQVDLV